MTNIKKMDILLALYVLCICCAELMGAKTFPLLSVFGYQFNASVGIFFVPLIYSVNDIITEVHGKERMRGIIKIGLGVVVILILAALFFTRLPPSTRFAPMETAYDTIFGVSIRMSVASLLALGIADFFDVFIFSKLRTALQGKSLWLRNNLSNILSLGLDTIIFMVLAFYSLDQGFNENMSFLRSIILPYWFLKCIMSGLITPFVYWGVAWLRKEKNVA